MPSHRTIKIITFICFLSFWQIAAGQNLTLKLYSNGISDRDLLELGNSVTRLNRVSEGTFHKKQSPDTLRILAIRVVFQEDSNDLTTGIGEFELTPDSEITIDSPPHGLTYFEHQLLALANYYKKVSRSKLILEADVYPKGPTRSYKLSQQMSAYSSANSEELLDEGLSQLFQEAFQLADTTDSIDFSRYDSFFLFHAGVGRDFAFDFNPTPLDIPSVFLDFGILKENLGNNDPSYRGIAVNGGSFFIRDGLILPETQSQQGFEIGLLGTMALMFGSQLGLPILFNPDTGLPGIGVFGLMDQGSGNFSGLLPAEPCAWSKIFLGWESPIEIREGDNIPIAASRASNQNKIYKIPIDSKEYFLLENRHRDFDNDNVAIGNDADGKRIEFTWTGEGVPTIAHNPGIGVITQVDEYDFGLPKFLFYQGELLVVEAGIHIWHIDERVIEANFASNRVNADPNHRGVALKEADGAQDLGQQYGFLSAGAGSENGTTEDMFWGSNPINMLVNNSTEVAFTPFTTPGSLSNSGANPQVFITDFSEPDTVMSFSVRNEITVAGFPQFSGSTVPLTNSPVIADLNNDANKEIIFASQTGTDILVWNSDGSKLIQNQDSRQIEKINGEIETLPLAIFASPKGSKVFSTAVASADLQSGAKSVVIGVTDQVVAAYLPEDTNPVDGRADSLYVFESPVRLTTPPLIIDTATNLIGFQVVVGTETGDLLIVSPDGSARFAQNAADDEISGLALLPPDKIAFTARNGQIGLIEFDGTQIWRNETNGTISKAPVIGDLDQNGNLNFICITDEGEIHVFDESGATASGFPKSTHLNMSSELTLGDIDDDGFLEIVFSAENKVHAFNHIGVLENHFPIEINSDQTLATTPSSLILVDLDDDGTQEIIVGSSNQLIAFHTTGQIAAGFPLSTGNTVNSTPFAADLDNDGDLDLAVASDDGFLYVWDLPNTFNPDNISWGGLFNDSEHSNANLLSLPATSPGSQLMPRKLVYNYPNPTEGNATTIRYTLNSPAQVKIKIYDLAGRLVDELQGTGFGQAENEVVWGLENIESGVYLARVEACGNGNKDAAIIKIAVVK